MSVTRVLHVSVTILCVSRQVDLTMCNQYEMTPHRPGLHLNSAVTFKNAIVFRHKYLIMFYQNCLDMHLQNCKLKNNVFDNLSHYRLMTNFIFLDRLIHVRQTRCDYHIRNKRSKSPGLDSVHLTPP